MRTFTQRHAEQTRENKASWLRWLKIYTPKAFLDAFLRNVEGAESTCVYCHAPIYVDVLIGGGVADWSTEDGDFGCDASPDTCEDGTGSHCPRKRSRKGNTMEITCTPYVGKLTQAQQTKLLDLLWDSLKHERGIDRVYTGRGTKTQTGLLACIEQIVLAAGL